MGGGRRRWEAGGWNSGGSRTTPAARCASPSAGTAYSRRPRSSPSSATSRLPLSFSPPRASSTTSPAPIGPVFLRPPPSREPYDSLVTLQLFSISRFFFSGASASLICPRIRYIRDWKRGTSESLSFEHTPVVLCIRTPTLQNGNAHMPRKDRFLVVEDPDRMIDLWYN